MVSSSLRDRVVYKVNWRCTFLAAPILHGFSV